MGFTGFESRAVPPTAVACVPWGRSRTASPMPHPPEPIPPVQPDPRHRASPAPSSFPGIPPAATSRPCSTRASSASRGCCHPRGLPVTLLGFPSWLHRVDCLVRWDRRSRDRPVAPRPACGSPPDLPPKGPARRSWLRLDLTPRLLTATRRCRPHTRRLVRALVVSASPRCACDPVARSPRQAASVRCLSNTPRGASRPDALWHEPHVSAPPAPSRSSLPAAPRRRRPGCPAHPRRGRTPLRSTHTSPCGALLLDTVVCFAPKCDPRRPWPPEPVLARAAGACGAPHHPSPAHTRSKPCACSACVEDPSLPHDSRSLPGSPPAGWARCAAAPARITLGAWVRSGCAAFRRPGVAPVACGFVAHRRPLLAARGPWALGRRGRCDRCRALPRGRAGTPPLSVRRACSDAAPRGSVGCRHVVGCRARVRTGRTALGRRVPVWSRSGRLPRLLPEGGRGWSSGRPSVVFLRHSRWSPRGRRLLRRAKCWMVPSSALPAVFPVGLAPSRGRAVRAAGERCSRK